MGGLSQRDAPFWPPQFTAPLMSKYLQVLYVRLTEFAEWYSNIRAGWVGRPDATLAEIVLGKSAKTFRPTNELWLVIQCSYRISETLLAINGVDDFNAVPDLLPALQASPFVKVYVLTATGLFQWSTATGWDEITPADRRGGRGSIGLPPGDEVYGCAGAPHGLPIIHQQQLNADLLGFIRS